MTGFGKFLVGAAVTSLLAWGANALAGDDYINGLEGNAKTAFAGLGLGEMGDVTMQRDALSRTAIVSGTFDEATKEKIRAELLAVPGVGWVKFADDGAAAAAAAPAATEEEVATCQTGVDGIMEGKTINFASGNATIDQASLGLVDTLATALKDCAGMTVAVGGHTDATGSDAVNQPLSQARADAVAAALTERGVEAGRVTATGYGSSQPKVEGMSAEANAANRRIEFTLSAGTAAPAQGE